MTQPMDYPTFIKTSKFVDALFHFGSLANNPKLSCNTEYHTAQAVAALSDLGQFPVVTCDEKYNRHNKYVLTIQWSFGQRKIALYPNDAKAAMAWYGEMSIKYYSSDLH